MVLWTPPLAWARGPRPGMADGYMPLARPPGSWTYPDPNRGGVSAVSKDGCLDGKLKFLTGKPYVETLPALRSGGVKGGWERLPRGNDGHLSCEKDKIS